ncbi:MAG TPA: Hsp20/alpha crystallin family protein [Ilumatobacteraceae bacterium]
MSLMRHREHDVDWPAWTLLPTLFERSFADLPVWKDLTGDSMLKVEEYLEDGKLIVRVEMPGLDPDKDIEINVSDGRLRVQAERRMDGTTDDKNGYHSEFRYGMFERTLRLPPGATEEDITATYTDGILEVSVPIDATEMEAKRIPVSTS